MELVNDADADGELPRRGEMSITRGQSPLNDNDKYIGTLKGFNALE